MIKLENVTKEYIKGTPALKNIDFEVNDGEFVFVVGNSGSGKSTLIKLLLRELKATSGKVMVNGYDLSKIKQRKIPNYRKSIGVVFQDFRLLSDRNVYENVAFALRVTEASSKKIKKRVPEVLSMVGLAEKYKAYPHQLSGGEQQRVAIARALVNDPELLLADEPTGNLDPKTSRDIMALIEDINQKGTTVLVVTHNKEIVNEMKKRVVTVSRGVIRRDEEEGEYVDEV